MSCQESFTLRNAAGGVLRLIPPLCVVEAHEGLGMAPLERETQQGPYQHGATLLAARLLPRIVTLRLNIPALTETQLRWKTTQLVRMLKQIGEAIYLDTALADGTILRLNVYRNDGLTLPRALYQQIAGQSDVVQFIADNPIAYSTAVTTTPIGITIGPGLLLDTAPTTVTGLMLDTAPTTVGGLLLGPSDVDTTTPITYMGTWLCYPLIRILGPIEDWVIANVTTGETLTAVADVGDVGPGAHVDIDLRYGYKTVRYYATPLDTVGTLRPEMLTTDSNLATWHLAPDWEAAGGVNSIHVTGYGGNGDTEVTLIYQTQWVSVL